MIVGQRLTGVGTSAEDEATTGARALAGREDAALLISGPAFGSIGRYSLMAAQPKAVFQIQGRDWKLEGAWPGQRPPSSASPFAALRYLLQQTRRRDDSPLPFNGGWIGYLGYGLAPLVDRAPPRRSAALGLPDARLGYFDAFAIHDRQEGVFAVHATDAFGAGRVATDRRRDQFRRIFDVHPSPRVDGPLVARAPVSDRPREAYIAAINRVLEYIRAGDIFQANLAQRFAAPWMGQVAELFLRLNEKSPAPFAALLRGPQGSVVSSSPERFFLLEPDGRVETRPIKGTRARGGDPLLDLLLREDLLDSAKDQAELTMIVDLERNDLGRVCEFGTVGVTRHAEAESYSNVHHLVSTVEGRLHSRFDVVDLIKATFPGGSITGAPKIRAMEIIDELEPCPRGVYTGAIGYISDSGRVDFNIAIRTIMVEGDTAHYHVGGGIVADSDPSDEFEETLAKGRRLHAVLTSPS